MGFFKPLIDVFTLGSDRPLRRLTAYYAVLGLIVFGLFQFSSIADLLIPSGRLDHFSFSQTSQILQDGLSSGQLQAPEAGLMSRLDVVISTFLLFLSTLALILPVTWVYMSDRKMQTHQQSMVETLIVLPIIVAGTVLVVRNSLALAFSLAGVVAAVRFRTSLTNTRDMVFIFLAIAIGFAAGVQVLTVAAVLSVLFNYLLVLSWHYDFGRNVLEPTAASQWREPLEHLAMKNSDGQNVPDRDLVLALTPKKVDVLAKRFNRIHTILGDDGKKPRFNAIVSVTTNTLTEAQQQVEAVLDDYTKRWKLDEVVTNQGKASELFYLVRPRKSVTRNDLVTAIRTRANGTIEAVDVEVGDALSVENGQIRDARKRQEHPQ